jgi:esterase/lipase superfamily enzyme
MSEEFVLRICRAFEDKSAERLPYWATGAAKNFVNQYSQFYSETLAACLTAERIEQSFQRATFLVQHPRYESLWLFSFERGRIDRITIERYRPVTLAGDQDWVEPFNRPSMQRAVPLRYASVESDPRVVEFLYATNRKRSEDHVALDGSTTREWIPISGYTGDRSSELSFGAVRVRIPETHKIGRIELPSSTMIFGFQFKNDDPDPAKHFIIRSIATTPEGEWVRSLSATNERKALIFVHGFNTSFRSSVFRTAQIIWDLQFRGATVLFSWPSRGEIADYFYDKDSALGSRAALLHILRNVHDAGFNEIHVVAHSMGNLITVDALSNSAVMKSPVVISQLVMAAPDVDRDIFIQGIPNVARVARGLTLYASANDKALLLSKRVAGNIARAGDVPPSGPIVLSPVSTIDVSAIGNEMFGLNHSKFAATRNILNDLKILLETGAPAPRLTEIRGFPEPPQKATYFRYVP